MISFTCLPKSCPSWLSSTLFCVEVISGEALILGAYAADTYFREHPPKSDIGKRIWNTYNKILPPYSQRKFTVVFLAASSFLWMTTLHITINFIAIDIFRKGFFKALPLIGQDLSFFSVTVMFLGLFYAWIYQAYRNENA